jgi:kynurenine formamidase
MRIRSFIIAYALVLAILLFADRRPGTGQENRFTKVVDLTEAPSTPARSTRTAALSGTRIISPAALIPGTWSAGQIPAERLVAPLVAIDVKAASDRTPQITLDDIATWESQHGMVPQGAVVALRQNGSIAVTHGQPLPITAEAAQFLLDARYVLGFAIETSADLTADRTLARQLALHGAYVVEDAAHLTTLPETGSLVIVAPAKNKTASEAAVRLLAMVR